MIARLLWLLGSDREGRLAEEADAAPPPASASAGRQTREERIRRGDAVRRLLEEPAVIAALEHLESEYIRHFRSSQVQDIETRETAYALIASLDLLRKQLRAVVDDGRLCAAQLEEEEASSGRTGRSGRS